MSHPVDSTPLADILRGYAHADPASLAALQQLDNWPDIARREIERRATRIIEALDDETLRAIAEGTVDFNAACRDAAATLAPKAA